MSFYDAGGRSNYFVEFGEGRPILLLHGISNSGRAWGPQIPALVEAGYRVIAPIIQVMELRGGWRRSIRRSGALQRTAST